MKWARRNPTGTGLVGLGAVAAAGVVWGLVALSYNADLAGGKRRLEVTNSELTGAKLGLETANGRLTETNAKLETAIGQVTKERNEADRLRGVAEAAWSPDGRRLAGASGVHFISRGTARVWDVGTGELVYHLRGHGECVWGVSFSPDGRRLATCSGNRSGSPHRTNGAVKVWDMDTGLELLTLAENGATAFDVSFSPDGRWLGAGYVDGKIRVWDLRPGSAPVAPPPRPVPPDTKEARP